MPTDPFTSSISSQPYPLRRLKANVASAPESKRSTRAAVSTSPWSAWRGSIRQSPLANTSTGSAPASQQARS